MIDGTRPYLGIVQQHVARCLSMLDREPLSSTYGCFDRTYWGWKFTDFPGARFQEGACTLALLASYKLPGVGYFGDPRLKAWAAAALDFWSRLQHGDGSFDEAYPWERSFAATAFTTFYAGEAYLLLEKDLPRPLKDRLRAAFRRAAGWLKRNDERHGVLSNHLAAAAAALHHAGTISEDPRSFIRRDQILGRIDRCQSSEGWFEEYGGADPGYQTHAMFYLARIWQLSQDRDLLERLRASARFLAPLIHPDGTVGGEYGSRNTEFYFPAAFEILAPVCVEAAAIAAHMTGSVSAGRAPGPAAMDPYNVFPMLNNYLFAAITPKTDAGSYRLACRTVGTWTLPEAGLVVRSTRSYYAVLGTSKGGVLKVWDKRAQQMIWSDCGFVGRTARDRVVTSQWLDRGATPTCTDDAWTVERSFVEVPQKTFSPLLFVAFRVVNELLRFMPGGAAALKRLLVRALIYRRRHVPLRLRRSVTFEEDGIRVEDQLTVTGPLKLARLRRGEKFAAIHMGSSRYFQPSELETPLGDADDLVPQLEGAGRVALKYRIAAGPVEARG